MLLERDTELALLRQTLSNLETTGGRVILIRGEAGIGKSALVDEFTSMVAGEAEVMMGGCDGLIIPQPLGPFWDMARTEPSLHGPLEAQDRAGVFAALMDLVSRTLRSTVVVIEDTHWADEATLDAIRYVGRRISRTKGLLLLTHRDGEMDTDHPLRSVIGDLPPLSVQRIQLSGLSVEAVTEMLGPSALDPHEVMAATHGNPFLVSEMASAEGGEIPRSLRDTVMARFARMSVGAQEALKLLAVIPEPIPVEDALRLPTVDETRLAEGERRGMVEVRDGLVGFRHDLIRTAVVSSLTETESVSKHRIALDNLPEKTSPSLMIHLAAAIDDVPRLLDLAPPSARHAAAMGSHLQAAEDFRRLRPHLEAIEPEEQGPILDEWAREELIVDNVADALELARRAVDLYGELGDSVRQSGALARAVRYAEASGDRAGAEGFARQAVAVLGGESDGPALAVALEANAYLGMMAGNVDEVAGLVERTLEAAGPDPDPRTLVRVLNDKGIVENIASYPMGRDSLDEAWRRAAATGQRYEECRALVNHGWAAAEFRDLPVASDYLQRAATTAVRHEITGLESYANALYARVLDLKGEWSRAEDLASEALNKTPLSQMAALPVLGVIAARKGRPAAAELLTRAWEMAVRSGENQRKAPAAAALAEFGWITGRAVPRDAFVEVVEEDLAKGFTWSPGAIAFWLWETGILDRIPVGAAEPYQLIVDGAAAEAAAAWEGRGVPYEAAVALMHGSEQDQLAALRRFEDLGATAVAAKLRARLRAAGVAVTRGRARATRDHPAGLTGRQSEILGLLAQGLTNAEISDQLFVSLRTVENHVSAVLMKLDVTDRAEAVRSAVQRGLLTP